MSLFSGGSAISHIIIDGYNVIGIFHGDIEQAREEFIDLLMKYRSLKGHDITVVFDGYKSGSPVEQAAVRGGLRIIYSRLAERADDVIKRIISLDRREWIVVSSDREIVNHAWSVNSIPVSSEKFLEVALKQVKKRAEADQGGSGEEGGEPFYARTEDDLEGDGSDASLQKGNPHRLSRKERAVRRALGKL